MVRHEGGATTLAARLSALLEERSRLRGEFELSSGTRSKYYFDAKPVTVDPVGINLVAQLMLPVVVRLGANAVGGLEMGAVPIALEIAKLAHSRGERVPACIVRDAKKRHGTKDRIAASYAYYELHEKKVAVVDDVVTTGRSLKEAISALRDEGASVQGIITLVTRPEEGGLEAMKKRFAPVPYESIFECDFDGNLTALATDEVAVAQAT